MRAPFNVLVLPFRARSGSYEYAVFHRADSDMWQFVAGGGEADEAPAAAARREAFEEGGIRRDGWIALDSRASIPRTAFPQATWSDDVLVIPEHCFAVEVEEIRLSQEHDRFEWLRYDDAHARLTWDSNRVALWELHQRLVPVQARIERAWREVAEIDAAYESGAIDQAGWHARMAALVVPAYLAGDNPRAQSGYSGDEAAWEQARSMVAEAIDRDGTFLDIGCASGLLMESVHAWSDHDVEPHGLDIAPELAALARSRCPQWADRIFVGNAADWVPPRRFDFVRTGLEYVPHDKRAALVEHVLSYTNDRLIIGPYSEEHAPTLEKDFDVAGRIERPHPRDDRVVRRLFWIEGDGTHGS